MYVKYMERDKKMPTNFTLDIKCLQHPFLSKEKEKQKLIITLYEMPLL
jgi:hypothetical protein